ncbi:hypothetical protein CHCC20335_0279 [Bacillus paralicheniformis]|nr:hypothetical protein CHCC20335_0279 [Bacillus paralicheniformis]
MICKPENGNPQARQFNCRAPHMEKGKGSVSPSLVRFHYSASLLKNQV